MLTLEERAELLGRANEMSGRGALPAIQDAILALDEAEVWLDPEFALLRAMLHYQLKEYDVASRWTDRLSDVLSARSFDRLSLRVLNLRGALWTTGGSLRQAESAFEEVYRRAITIDDQRFVAYASMNSGAVSIELGEWRKALTPIQRALTAFQRLGDDYNMAGCHQNLGIAYRSLGSLSESDAHFRQARRLYRMSSEDKSLEIAAVDTERAITMLLQGLSEPADALATIALDAILKQQASSGRSLARDEAEARRVVGLIYLRVGSFGQARNFLETSMRLAQTTNSKSLQGEVCALLGDLSEALGDVDDAAHLRATSDALFTEIGAYARLSTR